MSEGSELWSSSAKHPRFVEVDRDRIRGHAHSRGASRQRLHVGGVRGHEVRHLDHQVGGRAGAQQIVQQALADDVELDLASRRRPDVADGIEELGDVEGSVGAQGVDREARRGDRAIAVYER